MKLMRYQQLIQHLDIISDIMQVIQIIIHHQKLGYKLGLISICLHRLNLYLFQLGLHPPKKDIHQYIYHILIVFMSMYIFNYISILSLVYSRRSPVPQLISLLVYPWIFLTRLMKIAIQNQRMWLKKLDIIITPVTDGQCTRFYDILINT